MYRPEADTALLAGVAEEELAPGRRVLDLGTGCGPLAVAAARRGARVTAVDVSRRAVAAVLLNGVLNGRLITARRGDLVAPVRGRRFDLVVSNPPYVPGEGRAARGWADDRWWYGGPSGRLILDRLCAEAPQVLAPNGTLLLVHSALCGVSATRAALGLAGLRTEVVARARQPFGPVLRAQAEWLERRGLIEPGQREEELVVIRGVRRQP